MREQCWVGEVDGWSLLATADKTVLEKQKNWPQSNTKEDKKRRTRIHTAGQSKQHLVYTQYVIIVVKLPQLY